jgi:hypothetical protein
MTESEFQTGWDFLIAQPWGKPYREGAMAKIQLTLYWKQLKTNDPYVWQAVAEYAATGDHWPSLGELKQSIHLNSTRTPEGICARNATIPFQDAPWPLQICWTYQAQHHCTLKEAALTMLPAWLAENPHHEDYADARLFLEKAQQNFGLPLRKEGNIRCQP